MRTRWLQLAAACAFCLTISSCVTQDQLKLDYAEKIRKTIRTNVQVPPGTPSTARSTFSVVQVTNGEILSISLKSSSGSTPYDAAAERAIRLSTPLPLAPAPELFSRELLLTLKP